MHCVLKVQEVWRALIWGWSLEQYLSNGQRLPHVAEPELDDQVGEGDTTLVTLQDVDRIIRSNYFAAYNTVR